MADESDKVYKVIITATARQAIGEQVRTIAIDQQSPQNAAEWLDRVWTCIDGLEFLPKRYPKAQGYDQLPYVMQRVILDNHQIFFTVDDPSATVYVVGLRHGARLPGPDELLRDVRGDEPE